MSENTTSIKQSKFLDSETELLSSKFLGFIDTFKISISLFKQNVLQGFLLPYIIDFIGSIILYIPFVFLMLFSFLSIFDFNAFENPETIESLEDIFSFGFGTFLLIVLSLLSLLLPLIFSYFIRFKQFDFLLSDKESFATDFFKDVKRFFKVLASLFLTSLFRLLFSVLAIVSAFASFFSLFLLILSRFSSPEVAEFLEILNVDAGASGLWFVLSIFLLPLSVLAIMLIDGFLGLSELLILKKDLGIIESFKKSFELSKKYFWENVLRWFLFNLSLSGFYLVYSFIDSILTLLFNIIDAVLGFPLFSIVYGLISLFILIFIIFATLGILISFYITSFSNFLALDEKE